jgi:hypothetical protein
MKKKPKAAKPRKDCHRDFVTDTLGSVAAGFMMAGAMGRLNGNFGQSLAWKRSLLTFSILESGRIRIDGQWIEFLRKRFHEGEEFGIKLVSCLLEPALPHPFPPTRVDYMRDGSVSVNREYDYRSKFPGAKLANRLLELVGLYTLSSLDDGALDLDPIKDGGRTPAEMTAIRKAAKLSREKLAKCRVAPFQTIPPQPPGDSPSVINRRWTNRRFCLCSQRADNPTGAKFCQYCGGSLPPPKPEGKSS